MAHASQKPRQDFIQQERKRIAKRSRVREIVFGSQDGVTGITGIVSSLYGAHQHNIVIVIATLSAALAGMFSMAAGSYLSSRAEREVERSELRRERKKIRQEPEHEFQELVQIYRRQGLSEEQAGRAAKSVMKNPSKLLELMAHVELGVDPQPQDSPRKDAFTMGLSFLAGSMVPILPWFFAGGTVTFVISISLAAVALFAIGLVRGRLAEAHIVRSAIETLMIGMIAGGLGYLIGVLLPKAFGGQPSASM